MPLVMREINNAGSPLTDVNGNLLADILIRFTLVNSRSYAAGTFDVISGEPVAPGVYTAVTNASGIFSVNLWPTSRGLEERFYLVEIAPDSETVFYPPFKSPLVDGSGALNFLAFRLSGDTIAEWETTAFAAHVQDLSIHTPSTGNEFLSHCSIDAVTGLPLWDNAAWPGSGTTPPTGGYIATGYVATGYVV